MEKDSNTCDITGKKKFSQETAMNIAQMYTQRAYFCVGCGNYHLTKQLSKGVMSNTKEVNLYEQGLAADE